ncbi:MAG: alpha/beta hydrolase-fold protein [Archangium sp.]|nr:alpha/beta hydrolase-fold protein [Archangium sp.]MDP3153545.1 alpha/beta hydrolase-fold protein [Archangium sp.]MDP3574532.1 alpha/beta hydrolase-fold protein [Archangium sp.]
MPLIRFEQAGLSNVRLLTELWKREPPRAFTRVGDVWELELGALPVDRLEYALELVFPDGRVERRLDPHAPTVDAPFGPTSVFISEHYRAPSWVCHAGPAGTTEPIAEGLLWTAPGLTPQTPAPLIIAHDGPEYARLAGLTDFLAAAGVPPVRAVLLQPRARDEAYSASPPAAESLANELLPALEKRFAITTRIGLGASLGGLAMLHAHRRHPHLFSALVLQSGSFFQRDLDVHEHRFSRFERIDAFVREVATTPGHPIPVMLTCGSAEENLANNQAMARVLRAQGYQVELHTVRDGHTWTCWRDTLAQSLGALLGR